MPKKSDGRSGLIPSSVRRLFDERDEPRFDVEGDLQTAVLTQGGRDHVVRIGNISSSGAMVIHAQPLKVGERVSLQLLDHGAVPGHVRWVRDGRAGVNFAAPLD